MLTGKYKDERVDSKSTGIAIKRSDRKGSANMDREDIWEIIGNIICWGGLAFICFMLSVIGG